jgi:Flp pilus assembly protein TadG
MAPLSVARLRRAIRDARGAELVEFALVLPILLFVLAGILDMGFLFNNYEVVTNAAREGARLAAIPGWTDAAVKARVNTYITDAGLQVAGVTTTVVPVAIDVSGRSVNGVKVAVSYPYTYLILGPISKLIAGGSIDNITLKAAATMRTEVAAGL